jgi:large subunit ribosomal protein L28
MSDSLGIKVRLRLSTNAIRTVEKRGGLDNYLIDASLDHLSPKVRKIKKKLKNKREKCAAYMSAS